METEIVKDGQSDFSRFSVDGVVAEMSIEVENPSPTKQNSASDAKDLKENTSKLDETCLEDESSKNSISNVLDKEKSFENNEVSNDASKEFQCQPKETENELVVETKERKKVLKNDAQDEKIKKKKKTNVSAEESVDDKDEPLFSGASTEVINLNDIEKNIEKSASPPPSPPRLRHRGDVLAKISQNTTGKRKKQSDSIDAETKDAKKAKISSQNTLPRIQNLPFKRFNLKLKYISAIKEQIVKTDMGHLRIFHKILFDRKFPTEVKDIRNEILEFEGFSFKEKSESFEKRKRFLKQMPDSGIYRLCKVLNLKKGVKVSMISDILKFLLKPIKTMLSPMDPFHTSMQPIVKLESIPIGQEYFSAYRMSTPAKKKPEKTPSTKNTSSPVVSKNVTTSTKMSSLSNKKSATASPQLKEPISKQKVSFSSPKSNVASAVKKTISTPAKKTETTPAIKSVTKPKNTVTFNEKKNYSSSSSKTIKFKDDLSASENEVTFKKSESSEDSSPIKSSKRKRKLSTKLNSYEFDISLPSVMTKAMIIKKEIDEEEIPKVTSPAFKPKKPKMQASEKKIPKTPKQKTMTISVAKLNKPDFEKEDSFSSFSSDDTVSTEESSVNDTPKKRKFSLRVGQPLRSFSKIKASIEKANFSSLQRLHILLFGASDKAENLKGNILAFGGFPFLEGTDDWKQKEFLLSLLALNTLREYLNILCLSYGEEDQTTLIKKLMKFLAAPNKGTAGKDEIKMKKETKDSPINNQSGKFAHQDSTKEDVYRKKRKDESKMHTKGGHRSRKILMDEEQVKKLEAELVREQKAIQKEKQFKEEKYRQSLIEMTNASKKKFGSGDYGKHCEIMDSPIAIKKQTDAEQVQALLETVYRRRELKAGGAVISTPKNTEKICLGDLPNVKFLVVTANYNDLDVLHHLIYMTDSVKTRVRKNILDFAGFGFNEDSVKYKERMDFLSSLGYDIAKRIAFLLGLCPYKTDMKPEDLNELIMYFLMAPCKTSQVTIKDLPQTFFSKDMPHELCVLLEKHGESTDQLLLKTHEPVPTNKPLEAMDSLPEIKIKHKARKSMQSCLPVSKKSLSPSISTIPLKNTKPVAKPPSTPIRFQQSGPEFFVQTMPDGQQKTFKLVKMAPDNALYPVLKNKVSRPLSPAILNSSPGVQSLISIPQSPTIAVEPTSSDAVIPPVADIALSSATEMEEPFTADSELPSAIDTKVPSTTYTELPPVIDIDVQPVNSTEIPPIVSDTLLPPDILFKDNFISENQENIQKDQTILENQIVSPIVLPPLPASDATSEVSNILHDNDSLVSGEDSLKETEVEELHQLDPEPPTDAELYDATKTIIGKANFENLTLRNVVDTVFSLYPTFDLSHKSKFIKSAIKNLILSIPDKSDS